MDAGWAVGQEWDGTRSEGRTRGAEGRRPERVRRGSDGGVGRGDDQTGGSRWPSGSTASEAVAWLPGRRICARLDLADVAWRRTWVQQPEVRNQVPPILVLSANALIAGTGLIPPTRYSNSLPPTLPPLPIANIKIAKQLLAPVTSA